MTLELTSRSADETESIGRALGALLSPGVFVALRGDLGGGKTCFSRGIVAAVAPGSSHLVASPTFAIMNEYPGAVPVFHFDFYRLSGAGEIEELGFHDFFSGTGICIAEWPERLGDHIPGNLITVSFEYLDEQCRKLSISSAVPSLSSLLGTLAERLKSNEFL